MTVHEVTLDLLRSLGMTTIFGNPGSTELPLLSNLPDDFRYVLGLQEALMCQLSGIVVAHTRYLPVVSHSQGLGQRAIVQVLAVPAVAVRTPRQQMAGREFPASAQEWSAINQAQKEGTHLVDDLKQVSPGRSRLTASVGRNGIPGMLVAVLALIVAAALALFAAALIRRRGLGPRT